MVDVIFHNLKPSDLIRDNVHERMQAVVDQFPDLRKHRIKVYLSMENSPHHAGPDLFSVRLLIDGPRFAALTLCRSAENLYKALTDVIHRSQDHLSRAVHKSRARRLHQARKFLYHLHWKRDTEA